MLQNLEKIKLNWTIHLEYKKEKNYKSLEFRLCQVKSQEITTNSLSRDLIIIIIFLLNVKILII